MAQQTDGLQPTQKFTSPADLNKENAGKQPGKSFTDGQSGLIPGEIQVSAGGDMANSNSNDGFNHPVPVKHGKSAVINDPGVISSQSNNPTPTVALAQEAARIGNTGPNIGSNDVGNIGIASFSSAALIEKHVISGVYYGTFSGSVTVPLAHANAISILNVYSGATAAAGSFPRTATGLSGAGWSPAGSAIVFTNGLINTFSGAALVGQVPVSGADFYVDYTYQTVTAAPTTASFTGVDNNLAPTLIPNVGNRFAR
jgi:hypothetical protein